MDLKDLIKDSYILTIPTRRCALAFEDKMEEFSALSVSPGLLWGLRQWFYRRDSIYLAPVYLCTCYWQKLGLANPLVAA